MSPYLVPLRLSKCCFMLFFAHSKNHILVRIGQDDQIGGDVLKFVTHTLLSPLVPTDSRREFDLVTNFNPECVYIGKNSEIQCLKYQITRHAFRECKLKTADCSSTSFSVNKNNVQHLARVIIYQKGNLQITIDDVVHFDLEKELEKPYTHLENSIALQTLGRFQKIIGEENFSSIFDPQKNQDRLKKVCEKLGEEFIKPDETHLELQVKETLYKLKILYQLQSDGQPNIGVHVFQGNSIGILLPRALKLDAFFPLKIISENKTKETFVLKNYSVQEMPGNTYLNLLHPSQTSISSFDEYFKIIEELNRYLIINHLLEMTGSKK